MKRRLIYGGVIVVLLVNLAVGARIFHGSTENGDKEKDSAYPNLELFSYVMERVRKDYVDGKDITYQQLVHGALKGMIDTLDPHSEFLEPVDYKELQDDTQGTFGGLGIVIQARDNFITVVTPIEDTPGAKAGILSGDRIVRINGKSTEKMGVPDAVKDLRGEPGTDVTITVMRPATGQIKDYKLTRAIIPVDMIKDINGRKEFPLGPDKIGYIRITQFGEKTGEELENGLTKLNAQGMKALILDLRWNPGGLLDQAVEVCQKFLPRGTQIVSTEGRTSVQKYAARGSGDETHQMPIVLLVNYGSASASEIVAGCLQDLNRAIILGEKTFGKGSVQSITPLEDGSALRLTTAKYYTPSHKVIHEHGITPNISVIASDEEERDILIKRAPGGVESLEGKEREQVVNSHDTQMERAVDVLKGVLLFADRVPPGESGGKNGKMAAIEKSAKAN